MKNYVIISSGFFDSLYPDFQKAMEVANDDDVIVEIYISETRRFKRVISWQEIKRS